MVRTENNRRAGGWELRFGLPDRSSRGMVLGHCDGYRALLGWLNEGIRREIMRGWREGWIGCSLSVGIRCTVSVQVLVAKTLASSRDSVVLYT